MENNCFAVDLYGVLQLMKKRIKRAPILHRVSAEGDCESIIRLVCKGKHVNEVFIKDGGNTPLHYASAFGQTLATYILIRLGSELNSVGQCNFSPLDMSVKAGHLGTTHVLLMWGAESANNASFYRSAMFSGGESLVNLLLKFEYPIHSPSSLDEMLYESCLRNNESLVDAFLCLGADPCHKPDRVSCLISCLPNKMVNVSIFKKIFKHQLKVSEPLTPSPLKNQSRVQRRHLGFMT